MLVTGSKFQLAELCQHWTTLQYSDEAGASASEGTRKHAVIRDYIEHGVETDEPWFLAVKAHLARHLPKGEVLTEIAMAIGTDGSARILGTKHERDYSQARKDDLVLTSDLVVIGDSVVNVWDWKTGKHRLGPAEESLQLGAGALAACILHKRPSASVAYKYVSEQRVTTDSATLDSGALRRIASRLRTIRGLGTAPRPGEHCAALWCPARGVCPAWLVSGTPVRIREKEKRVMGKMSLQNVSKGSDSPLCLMVYGRGGVGKTTFATGAPAPIFLCEKDGLRRHPTVDRFPDADCWEDVLEATDTLTGKHAHRTLVIDTLDWVESFIRAKITADQGKFDEDFGKGYKLEIPYWMELQRRLDKLRVAGMNIVLLSHATVKQRRDPTTEPFDCWIPSLAPVIVDLWRNWSSALLYAAYEMAAVTEGKGASKKVRGVSDGARVLYTDERAGFVAKNRYGLPFELPLEWADFETAARAGHVEDPAVIRAAIEALATAASEKLAAAIAGHLEKVGTDVSKLAKLLNWAQAMANKESEVAA